MKVLVFTGGFGNQIFEYAFYLHLKKIFPNSRFYGLYGKKLTEHYGLEIDKWFHTELPEEKWWTLPLVGLFYFYKQCFPYSSKLDLNQREWIHKNAVVFYPFKFTKEYVPRKVEWLKWKVDETQLCNENKKLIDIIRRTDSCFVHVRKGDYQSPAYKDLFEGCCSIEYYRKALSVMKKKNDSMQFICFSDDLNWVKNNMSLSDNTIYVDWNTGTDSPLDMYLMSQCKNAIIANSTFSYWGASLGVKKETIVYPQRWWNHKDGNPDIFFDNWIGVD